MKRWEGTAVGVTRLLPMRAELAAKFWLLVDRKGAGDCWPWLGRYNERGYGAFSRGLRAHRAAYALATGHDPIGQQVMHSCDNRPCCNPAHLSAGPPLRNSQDAVERGRIRVPMLHGEKNGRTRISRDMAKAIILRIQAGADYRTIAPELHIPSEWARNIQRGKSWAALAAELGGLQYQSDTGANHNPCRDGSE